MNIEYTSLKRNYDLFAKEYEEALLRAFRSGWYILGPELEQFEIEFARKMGRKYCVGVNSGTDALILAIRALEIGEGDEVIVPAGTYIATVLGITENGATPVYVDSNDKLLMDTHLLEQLITPRTKAILPVHLYGQVCNMTEVKRVAEKYNLYVIEDCAQCHGAQWEGQMSGTFGDIGCFSFYPTKPLGAFGDAGALLTDSEEVADRLKMLRNYGSRIKYHNEIIGVNSRLDEIQAAGLLVGLKHLDETNGIRIKIAEKYLSKIKNDKIKLPINDPKATNVYHLFPVLVDKQEKFQTYMHQQGIKTQIHYPIPPYVAECFVEHRKAWEDYPRATYIARHEVSLPIYAGMTDDEIEYVIDIVNKYA